MKKTLASLLLAVCGYSSAATLVPIQLLNPTGSTAGQMIVSQGASSVPAWSNSVQNLSVNGTTTLTNTAAGGNVLKLTGNGATTPNKFLGVLNGGFTIFSSSGSTQLFTLTDGGALNILSTFTPTGGIVGVTTNSNAAAGNVGEFISNAGTGVSFTSGTAANLTVISLTAGDWDVSGTFQTVPAATTTTSLVAAGISQTSATLPASNSGGRVSFAFSSPAQSGNEIATPTLRVSLTATTNVYLVGFTQFATSTMTGNGFIRARRVR